MESTELLANQMEKHRNLKAEKAEIDILLSAVRQTIEKLVHDSGDYTDDIGYARLQRKSAYEFYPAKEITRQAHIWAASDDPAFAICGETLRSLATIRPAKTVLVVK